MTHRPVPDLESVLKEIVEEILQTEKEARARVESAREQAKANRLNAEGKAAEIKQQARESAAEEARRLIADAEAEAVKEKEERLKTAADHPEYRPGSSVIEKAAIRIFQRIIQGEKG